MSRTELIAEIEHRLQDDDLTIHRKARFKKRPFAAAIFYTLVALNRYTPFLIPINATTAWGHTLKAYETSAIGSMYFLGFYDSDITLFLLKHYKESGDILDVGANIGVHTSLFSYVANKDARVVAFEPTPSTFAVLKENMAPLANVTCESIALSDTPGTITFYDYGLRNGVFNSSKRQPLAFLAEKEAAITVPSETLDAYCKKHSLQPALIKLDTEGTEAAILSQAEAVIAQYHPTILLEVGGGEAWKDNVQTCLDTLLAAGYELYTATTQGDLVPHTRQATYTYQNLIIIHSSKRDAYASGN